MKRFFLSLCLVPVLLPMFGLMLTERSQSDFSALEQTALAELKETNTPGAAVVIVSGDRVVFAKGFGIANVETGAPVTPDMLFRIGSMTKMFTAATLVSLAEEGKLKLDAPIGGYVKGLSAKFSPITAHQLLSHTAGVRDEARPYGAHDESALGGSVRTWKDDFLFTEPGEIFSYSNAGFALAGLVIEETSGKPYADQITQYVFKPLGMARSTFRPTVAMTYPLAQGHQANANSKPVIVRPFTDNVAGWPAGFMFSSAHDLARFALAFVNHGKIEGQQVLSPAVIAKLSTPYTDVPGFEMKYAYGLRVTEYRGVRLVEHGGAIPGFGAEMKMSPEHRFAVIVLGNRSGARLEKTVEKAMELMLPLKAKVEDQPPVTLPISQEEMTRYLGLYTNGQSIEIVLKEGQLCFQQRDFLFPLTKVGPHRFTFSPDPGEVEECAFVADHSGKIQYLHRDGRAFKKTTGT